MVCHRRHHWICETSLFDPGDPATCPHYPAALARYCAHSTIYASLQRWKALVTRLCPSSRVSSLAFWPSHGWETQCLFHSLSVKSCPLLSQQMCAGAVYLKQDSFAYQCAGCYLWREIATSATANHSRIQWSSQAQSCLQELPWQDGCLGWLYHKSRLSASHWPSSTQLKLLGHLYLCRSFLYQASWVWIPSY